MTKQTLFAARTIVATPRAIFRAFVDPDVAATWRVPGRLTAELLDFDARAGGGYRLSLSSPSGEAPLERGIVKASFVELLPDEKVVETIAFTDGDGPDDQAIIITTTLVPVAGGTKVSVQAENIPPSFDHVDLEAGLASVLKRLANLLE